jgi:hypothetical protein
VKKVMVRRMIEKLMEVDLLVVNQMKKPIVLIMMKEEIVVNQVVIDHRSMELNKERKHSKIEISIADEHGGPNDERSELYGVGLIGQRSDVGGSKSQGKRSNEGAAH